MSRPDDITAHVAGQRHEKIRLRKRPTRISPPCFYKFRSIPASQDVQGRAWLEDLLLNNKLWLAAPSTFNDPFDGRSAYGLTLRGPELRKELERLLRRQGMKSQEARKHVRSDVIANPEWFRAYFGDRDRSFRSIVTGWCQSLCAA